jgi:hypothetical protein
MSCVKPDNWKRGSRGRFLTLFGINSRQSRRSGIEGGIPWNQVRRTRQKASFTK